MNTMRIMQGLAAAGVLLTGTLLAARGDAYSCGFEKPWGYESPTGCDCNGMGCFTSTNKGESNATIAADLVAVAEYEPLDAIIAGLDPTGSPISGCVAEDTTANGESVSTSTGCQEGVSLYMQVDANWNP